MAYTGSNILGDTDLTMPDMLTDKIFIGNMNHASNKKKLEDLGITSILICGSYIEPNFPKVKKINLKRIKIKIGF